jgi:hypothetical protein
MSPNQNPALEGTPSRGYSGDGAGAVPGAAAIHCRSGRPWASNPPARDRSARCSLHWRRGGSSRLHPAIPGSAARGRVERSHSRRMTAVGAVRRGRRRFGSCTVWERKAMVLAGLAAGFSPSAAGADPEGAPSGARLPSFEGRQMMEGLSYRGVGRPRMRRRIARTGELVSAPAIAGEGDRPKGGGGGAGHDDTLATKAKRRVRGPFHRARARSPFPASRGRMDAINQTGSTPILRRRCG